MMKIHLDLPSRGKCRYLWTLEDYAAIAHNYESNNIYRHIFIKGPRRLDLEAIYCTALLHLGREEELSRYKSTIETLKDSALLSNYLELNKFSIDHLGISPNDEMSKAYDAIQIVSSLPSIDMFWKTYCSNKRISIVGNAPFRQNLGNVIDNCDYVLRFNKFQTNNYELLVGSKTDVWCRICDIQNDHQSHIKNNITLNILTDNPLNVPTGPHFLRYILQTDKKFFLIPQKLVLELSTILNAIPSSGARVLVSLSQCKDKFNIQPSIFGFSFCHEGFSANRFDHYFEQKQETKERTHSISSEVTLLRKLYKYKSP